MTQVVISGTGVYTPPHVISNQELVAAFNQYVSQYNATHEDSLAPSDEEFIFKASGIKQRFVMDKKHILDPEIMAPRLRERSNEEPSIQCEMAVAAAQEALTNAQKKAEDIDAVLIACSNMQRPYPAIAIEVQHALGIQGFGYDLNVACSSATFGIQAAFDAIRNQHARAVLVVNPEICSAHLNFRDRESHFIFGDACTATVIERADLATSAHRYQIIDTQLTTQFSNNIRNNFGFLNRTAPEHANELDKLFVQQGRKVFKEVIPLVTQTIQNHLTKHQLRPSDIQRFWLHQANLNMNLLIAKKLLGEEPTPTRVPIILDQYANTSSAGVILAFHFNHQDLHSGQYGVICSFGAGYSIGNVLLQKL